MKDSCHKANDNGLKQSRVGIFELSFKIQASFRSGWRMKKEAEHIVKRHDFTGH